MIRNFFMAALLLSFAGFGNAAKVENLYRANFEVESQDPAERDRLVAAGLGRVLMRVSGRESLPASESLNFALGQAARYLQQFGYDRSATGFNLNLNYSRSAIDSLLRKADLPIWPDNRPQVLLWLVQDNIDQRALMAPAEVPGVLQTINTLSADRGLPISLPLMDLDDRIALSRDQAWQLDENALAQASERYPNDATVLGRMSLTGSGQWRGSWLLLDRGQIRLFDAVAVDMESLIEDGLNQVASYLGQQHAIVASPVGLKPEIMQLSDVADFESYVKILNYLNTMAMVRYAEPELIDGKKMRLRLFIDGQLQQLTDAIALDSVLQPRAPRPDEASGNGVLFYKLYQQLADTVLEGNPDASLEAASSTGVQNNIINAINNVDGIDAAVEGDVIELLPAIEKTSVEPI